MCNDLAYSIYETMNNGGLTTTISCQLYMIMQSNMTMKNNISSHVMMEKCRMAIYLGMAMDYDDR
jgi:hypothetical protein